MDALKIPDLFPIFYIFMKIPGLFPTRSIIFKFPVFPNSRSCGNPVCGFIIEKIHTTLKKYSVSCPASQKGGGGGGGVILTNCRL
jgi:hypothetical protein